ncbi:PREDICTED: uncharacterized protein LOC105561223, partial [Vollenhovia emeryi]|uniref:uncharacterized protein LOC105561223 n=1 Tax=Vollenhovia emeryi TaxID=411798 RepID=UPI0005F5452C
MTENKVSEHQEGFFKATTLTYGYRSTMTLKAWLKINIMIATAHQQLTFLLRSRHFDILPTHIYKLRFDIKFVSKNVNYKYNNYKKRYQKTLLNFEIRDINCKLHHLQNRIKEIEKSLFLQLPETLVNDFFKFNRDKVINHNNKTKTALINKFNRILHKDNPLINNDKSKWIVNTSKKQIPEDILMCLSLGDRFGLPIDSNDKTDRLDSVLQVIKNFELNITKISIDAANDTRGSLVNILLNFLSKNKHISHIEKFITDSFRKCKKYLKNNNDLLITNADKGQVTVVMDKNTYIQKMTNLLNDNNTYKKLKSDPINRIKTRVNDLIKSWWDKKIIDEYTYKQLRCTNGNLPRCYGLPKVHKTDFPLRIIVSTVGSPTYKIAKFLGDILQKSIQRPSSHIKDSWSFVKKINRLKIRPDQSLVSLDATSLFTNIPKELVLRAIEHRWDMISKNTKLNLQQFSHAIDLILTSTSFCFNAQFYDQVFGTPMGSPLSPILADMVLDDLETHCLQLLDNPLTAFFRYVDDIFTIVPTSKINEILNLFNNYHQRLKFTCEIETNGSLSFLDTMVIRNDDALITN